MLFPAVDVTRPRSARGWCVDGGIRLNTPIKPALELGAARVVVIALNPLGSSSPHLAGERRPDALEGAAQILIGILQDQLAGDVQTLAGINQLTTPGVTGPGGKRQVPYILIAPGDGDPIADLALRVVRRHYTGPLHAIAAPDIALLARLTAAGADVDHAALLSFLLFAAEFSRGLIELGRQDAQRWVDQPHDLDDLWQVSPIA